MPATWRDDDARRHAGRTIRRVRRVVTGALEIERAQKRIGSSLEAAPIVYLADDALCRGPEGRRLRRGLHHLGHEIERGRGPADAFRLDDVKGVAVVPALGRGPQMRPLLEDLARRRRRTRSIPM